MGLADQIVMLAFGLILGSAAVATAIAFGLGGRDYAARLLEEWHEGNAPPPARRPAQPRLKKAPSPEDDSQPPLVQGAGKPFAKGEVRRLRVDRKPGEGEGGEGVNCVAIDWSGAKGRRHKGIAIAEARGDDAAAPGPARPCLVARGGARLAAEAGSEGADPVRLRLQLRPALCRARRLSARRARACPTMPARSGPMSMQERRRGSWARHPSWSRLTAAISISASPMG